MAVGGEAMDSDSFAGRLLTGERILWTGQPAAGLLFTSRDIFLVPFSLAWLGIVVSSFGAMFGHGVNFEAAGPMFVIFPAVFLCVGLYFVFGRFAVDAWLRSSTRYAVTDRRILITRSGPFSSFTALGLDRLPDTRLTERAGGRGTIVFGSQMSFFGNRSFGLWSPALDSTPQFLAIENVRDVFNIIQRQSGSDR